MQNFRELILLQIVSLCHTALYDLPSANEDCIDDRKFATIRKSYCYKHSIIMMYHLTSQGGKKATFPLSMWIFTAMLLCWFWDTSWFWWTTPSAIVEARLRSWSESESYAKTKQINFITDKIHPLLKGLDLANGENLTCPTSLLSQNILRSDLSYGCPINRPRDFQGTRPFSNEN